MATPHKCPVCKGCGRVSWPPGWPCSPFFAAVGTGGHDCPCCGGTGVVWEPEQSVVEAKFQTETHST